MRIAGKLRTVQFDGYERLLEVVQDGESTSLWVSALDHAHYAEGVAAGGQYLEGQYVELDVSLRLVVNVEPGSSMKLGLTQPIAQSAHSVVVTRVAEIIDPETFAGLLGSHGPIIRVETEGPLGVVVGQIVTFTAELSHVA